MSLESVGTFFGVVGGILGCWSFIDNNLLRFSPKFQVSNTLFFKYYANVLQSVIIQIQVLNTRNKIGRIDDFAIRIYDPRGNKPRSDIFFAKNEIDEFSLSKLDAHENSKKIFSPISVLNKSNISVTLEFRSKNKSHVKVYPSSVRMDLMYFSSSGKWHRVGSYTPFALPENDKLNGVIECALICAGSRDESKLTSVVGDPKTSSYEGVTGKYLGFYLMKPIYFIKRLVLYPPKLVILASSLIKVFITHILSYAICPFIQFKSRKLSSLKMTWGRPHLVNETDETIKEFYNCIKCIVENHNKKAANDAKIIIHDEEKLGFTISRNKGSIKFYKSGDGYIRADGYNRVGNSLEFDMRVAEYLGGRKIWKVNNKIKSKRAICVYIMDYFLL